MKYRTSTSGLNLATASSARLAAWAVWRNSIRDHVHDNIDIANVRIPLLHVPRYYLILVLQLKSALKYEALNLRRASTGSSFRGESEDQLIVVDRSFVFEFVVNFSTST